MPIVTRHSLITVVVLALSSLLIIGIFIWTGIYNIGADDTHTKPVYSILEMMRERSITARAHKLHPPPNLNDPVSIRQGAGNYNAMCTGCHLAPGMQATELSKGLYPSPPNLSQADVNDPSHHFWVIKHGIKASGMPAWGKSMGDAYIWNMVAFLKVLPNLDAGQYKAMVASSGGHAHGGGESMPHGVAATVPGGNGHAGDAMPTDESSPHDHAAAAVVPPSGTVEHRHADGTVESHPSPPPAPADPGHDAQH